MVHRLVFEGEARDRMMDACAVAGVPPGVLKMLIHLDPEDATAMRDLASHFGVDASYVTSLVDDLERSGLAERRPHPTDRRVKTIALTPKGVEVRDRVAQVMGEPPACLAALSAAEQRMLRELLAKAVAADAVLAQPPAAGRRGDGVRHVHPVPAAAAGTAPRS
jgi:DNA-binding MarR family transcriptional regulator